MRSTSRESVVEFRIARHGLGRRASRRTRLDTVVPLGLQDTADHGAAWALALRRESPRADDLTRAVHEGNLKPTWGPRLAAWLTPADTETWMTRALLDPAPDTGNGGDADKVAALAAELAPYAVEQLRDRGPLTKEELGKAIARRTPSWAMQDCQRCGRRHPSETLVKTLVWTHRIRLEPPASGARAGGRVAPASRWRPRRYRTPRQEDRAELVRHCLHRNAPSTPKTLAEWMGATPAYAEACWQLVEDELAQLRVADGPVGWALAADLDELADPPAPPAARLVPPYDPLLQLRDRETLIPDRKHRTQTWRAVANPGLLLLDGAAAGTWRGRRRDHRLEVRITPFDSLGRTHRGALEEDLASVAVAIGAETAEVVLA